MSLQREKAQFAAVRIENFLRNIEAQLGRPRIDDPVKKAAYEDWLLEHNTRVRQILKAKGFT